MTILFITPYFPPEVGAAQTRIYEQAVRLCKKGHRVCVLTTFPSYPSGVVPDEWKGRIFWRGVDQGIAIYRFWTYATANKGFYRRVLSQLSFALLACIAGLWCPRTDVMIIESPPLFNGIPAVVLSALKRVPYAFHVSDLWPETAVQLGALMNPTLVWLARRMETVFYRRAALVLAVTEGIRDAVATQVGPDKAVLLRNAVDTNFFRPVADGAEVRRRLGKAPGEFLVLYAGTIGMSQQLEVVLATALLFQRASSNVRFVLAGDGAERETLSRKSLELGLSNVRFVAPFPKTEMPWVLNAADCVLVSLKNVPIFHAALPTKLFEAMACGRPVVLAALGEAEEVLTRASGGYCVPPGDAEGIRDAIVKLQQRPDVAASMGARGRNYMLRHFSRDERVEQLTELLRTVVQPEMVQKVTVASTNVG